MFFILAQSYSRRNNLVLMDLEKYSSCMLYMEGNCFVSYLILENVAK